MFIKNLSALSSKSSFLLYLFVLLSPSMMFSAKGFVRALYPLLILIGLINRRRPFLLLTLPVVLLVPAALFLQSTFHAPMNESFWLIISGSNLNEANDYLAGNAAVPLLSGVLVLIGWWYLYRNYEDHKLVTSPKLRSIFCLLLIVPLVHLYKGRTSVLKEFNHHFTESFPINIAMSYGSAKQSLKEVSERFSYVDIEDLTVQATAPAADVVVLVIGESARRDRHQLYGAPMANNPLLSQKADQIFLLRDFISLHPHTVGSVPVMLNKRTGFEKAELGYSFVQVFKAAGFYTNWISNQASLGGDGILGRYARDTDFNHFFHLHEANNPTVYDEEILRLFRERVQVDQRLDRKSLFVLHLQGSHYGFEKRYPRGFGSFSDPYDNTIQYTDLILSGVIDLLREQKRSAVFFYVSDHGLLLNECGKKYTHFDNKESYEVPAVIWVSEEWKKSNSKKLQNIARNLDRPATTQVVFDSLVDLANIKYNGANKKWSLANESFSVGPRLVKTYSGVVDYDGSTNDARCHLKAASSISAN